jgi:hypothetical protein
LLYASVYFFVYTSEPWASIGKEGKGISCGDIS